jgi:iron(III) transport system permease protein
LAAKPVYPNGNRLARRLWPGGERLTLAALVAFGVLLCGMPLVLLAKTAFISDGLLTLTPLLEALQSRPVLRALGHSVESSVASAALAAVMGTIFALVIGLTDVRARGPLIFLMLLPMMIPPHVTAISWIQALGPGSPLLNWLGLAPKLGSTHPLYSAGGVILLLALQHTPLVFLMVYAAVRTLPREMSDAARCAGAGSVALVWRIVLPLLGPTLISGFSLAFIAALGNFGIQALLGIPARYITLPVLIWQRLASFGPGVLGEVAVISTLVAGVAIIAITLQFTLQRRLRSTLIGPPQPPLNIRLKRARPFAELALWLVIAATFVLPISSLVATALVSTYGLPLNSETLTFEHFREVLFTQSVTLRAFANSTMIAGAAAAIISVGAAALGYFLYRPGRQGQRIAGAVATLADVAYAIPGLVISIAFILAFIRPLPIIGVSLYGTFWIILIAYLAAFFSIALKPVGAAYAQLDSRLDDAARVAGAHFGRRMRRIFMPLMAPAAASGAILVFLTAYNEITVSALLWSTGNETIGTTIFNYEDGGYTTIASAMSTITVLVTVLLMLALQVFGRRLPAGVVPWRF